MPDDLQIPIASPDLGGRTLTSTTYRPRASGRRNRALPIRTALIAAATICGIGLTAIGGWSLLHRTPAQVPVIEADARPIRVKPENAGGLQVAAAEDATTGPGDQRMAPAAEAPAPRALRAQMQPPAPPPALAIPAAPSDPAPAQTLASSPTPPLPPSPLPDTPRAAARTPRPTATVATLPAATLPAATPPAATPPVAPPGTAAISVQIAAVDTEPAAQTEWQRLQKRLPDLLSDRRPLLQKAERDGRAIWRVRVPGFTDIADATAFCTKVRARGANCAIASF